MRTHGKIRAGRERGQILPLMALVLVLLMGMVGLAIDLGRMYVTKTQLSRSLDAAALAGAKELPSTANATTKAQQYLNINMPQAQFLTPLIDVPNQKVTINAKAPVKTIFLRLVGIDTIDVVADAQAGASNAGSSALPLDAVVLLDDTGTMGSGCTDTQRTVVSTDQTSPLCPIGMTRNGAKAFIDVLAQNGTLPPATHVGYLSFRGCYADTNINPYTEAASPSWNVLRGCVKLGDTIALSNSVAAIKSRIDTMEAAGGFPGTNLCLGLARGYKTISGAGSQAGARKVLVILTDGENRYSDNAYNNRAVTTTTGSRQVGNAAPNTYPTSNAAPQTNGAPPADATVDSCYPAGSAYDQDSTDYGADYDKRTNYLDVHTLAQADAMKAAGVEVFVIGFGVNGPSDLGTSCNAAMRGRVGTYAARQVTGSGDTQGDRELAKCLASSKAGSNDHYFETDASGLPAAFTTIATQISYRLLK